MFTLRIKIFQCVCVYVLDHVVGKGVYNTPAKSRASEIHIWFIDTVPECENEI